jgi:hypothetical protein
VNAAQAEGLTGLPPSAARLAPQPRVPARGPQESDVVAPAKKIMNSTSEFVKLFTSYLSPKGEGNIMFENFKIKVPNSAENRKILELKKASIIHAFLNKNSEYVQRNADGIWVYGVDHTTLPASEWQKMFSKLT